MTLQRAPGAGLLHPVTLASVVVLLLNDHVIKRAWPGVVSGKLSDLAGVVLLPLFLQAAYELAHSRLCRRPASQAVSRRVLGLGVAATCIAFALPELWGPADAAYRFGLGVLQWPFQTLVALCTEARLAPLRPVQATMDPSDLIALPMALVAWRVGRGEPFGKKLTALLSASSFVAVATWPDACAALEPPRDESGAQAARPGAFHHDGFFLGLEFGGAVLTLDSTASISNGFEQEIPSSASGVGPSGALEIGGTLPDVALVLGGRLAVAQSEQVVIETLGERFMQPAFKVSVGEIAGFAEYYPDPASGLHFGGGVGLCVANADGRVQRGWCASLEAGHGFWLGRQTSLGAALRLLAGSTEGESFGQTTLFVPSLLATFSWH